MQTGNRTEATDSTSAGSGASDAGRVIGESAGKDLKPSEDLAVSSEMACLSVNGFAEHDFKLFEDPAVGGELEYAMSNITQSSDISGIATKKFRYVSPLSKEVDVFVRKHGLQVLDFEWLKENAGNLAYRLGGSRYKIEEIAEELGLKDAMVKYERDKLLASWKAMVDEHGLNVYKQRWLQDNKLTQLLTRSKRRGLRLIDVAKELGDDIRLKNHRATTPSSGKIKWSSQKFDEIAREVIDRFGCIPSGTFLIQQGYGGFVWQYSVYGPVENVRQRYNVQNVRLSDIDNNVYLSLPEVCFSNYMLARNFVVERGDSYPEEYVKNYNRKRGMYDFHFLATQDEYAGKRISVEIFGGGGACRNEETKKRYLETKKFKIEFHQGDKTFLAIEYDECYTDNSLTEILRPYIGEPPVMRNHELVQLCPTTQLSQADLVLDECRIISRRMPTGKLPSTQWFQMSGHHVNRERYDWEPHRWAGFLVRLRRIGMANVREALGQEQLKPVKWTLTRFYQELSEVLRDGFATPRQAFSHTEKKWLNERLAVTHKKLNQYHRLQVAWYKMTNLSQTPRNAFLLCALNTQSFSQYFDSCTMNDSDLSN